MGTTANILNASAAELSGKPADREDMELNRVKCVVTESLFKRLLRKVFPDQRKQERIPVPPLVGYLGTMQGTRPFEIGDISLSGFCLLTEERWTSGTEMPVTLRRTDVEGGLSDQDVFTVQATVVRSAENGVGFSIVLSEEESNAVHGNTLRVKWASRSEMERFLKRLKGEVEAVPSATTETRPEPELGESLKAAFDAGRQTALPQGSGD